MNVKNNCGNTAHMRAVSNGYLEIIKLLIVKGVDMSVVNNEGLDALVIAGLKGDFEIVRFLMAHGAVTPVDVKAKIENRKTASQISVTTAQIFIPLISFLYFLLLTSVFLSFFYLFIRHSSVIWAVVLVTYTLIIYYESEWERDMIFVGVLISVSTMYTTLHCTQRTKLEILYRELFFQFIYTIFCILHMFFLYYFLFFLTYF
jgi:hypothetical protein